MPPPSQVPTPVFPSVQDIKLYTLNGSQSFLTGPHLSRRWQVKGPSADFFTILDHVVRVPSVHYRLQKLDAQLPVYRSSPGNITAGNYVILPSVAGEETLFKALSTFFNISTTETITEPPAKLNGGEFTTSQRSVRDRSDGSQGFKMRLVHRDKGCVVCLATGVQDLESLYLYFQDSDRFEGCHIIDLVYQDLWDADKLSTLVTDPFVNPSIPNNQNASPSTQTKKDHIRINSLKNGILLCSNHQKDYDDFRFSIHPEVKTDFPPSTARLQDAEVKAPWDNADAMYPPPHPALLKLHYQTSVAKAMKASGGNYELDDDDDDDDDESWNLL